LCAQARDGSVDPEVVRPLPIFPLRDTFAEIGTNRGLSQRLHHSVMPSPGYPNTTSTPEADIVSMRIPPLWFSPVD